MSLSLLLLTVKCLLFSGLMCTELRINNHRVHFEAWLFPDSRWMVALLHAVSDPEVLRHSLCLAAGFRAVWDLSSSGIASRLNTLFSSALTEAVDQLCGHVGSPTILTLCLIVRSSCLSWGDTVPLAGSFTLCSNGNCHIIEQALLRCLQSANQSDPLWRHSM